jgi:hypothetical protein
MTIYPTCFGHVALPSFDEARPPRYRPDGVRVVRRPQPRLEALS